MKYFFTFFLLTVLSISFGQKQSEIDTCGLIIPKSFTYSLSTTPTFFVIQNIDIFPHAQLMILSRKAEVVFMSEQYFNNWDGSKMSKSGRLKNKKCKPGLYFYRLLLRGNPYQPCNNQVVAGYLFIKHEKR